MIGKASIKPPNRYTLDEFEKILADELIEVLTGIAGIAQLNFNRKVNLEFSDEVTSHDIIALVDAGLAKRELIFEYVPEYHNWPEIGQDRVPKKASSDILGRYYPGDLSLIVIYTRMCRLVAGSLETNSESLMRVVLAHEAAHAVTHLGREKDGRIWDDFSEADKNDKEKFAQAYALAHFKDKGLVYLEEIFNALSHGQSDEYNAWREYI